MWHAVHGLWARRLSCCVAGTAVRQVSLSRFHDRRYMSVHAAVWCADVRTQPDGKAEPGLVRTGLGPGLVVHEAHLLLNTTLLMPLQRLPSDLHVLLVRLRVLGEVVHLPHRPTLVFSSLRACAPDERPVQGPDSGAAAGAAQLGGWQAVQGSVQGGGQEAADVRCGPPGHVAVDVAGAGGGGRGRGVCVWPAIHGLRAS